MERDLHSFTQTDKLADFSQHKGVCAPQDVFSTLCFDLMWQLRPSHRSTVETIY